MDGMNLAEKCLASDSKIDERLMTLLGIASITLDVE